MNINRIIVICLLAFPSLVFGQDDSATAKLILHKLFAVNKTYVAREGNQNVEIISARLRGQWASIPLNHCFLQTFDSDVAALAFELYLSPNAFEYKNLIDTLNHLEFNDRYGYIAKVNLHKVKLIQLVYFDLANRKFIAKPEGFPIEQRFWMADTYGDVGSRDIQIKSFEGINNSLLGCKLELSTEQSGYGDDSYILKIIKLTNLDNQLKLLISKDIEFGSFGGAIGCEASIEYRNIVEQGSEIIAEKHTQCNCNELEVDCEGNFGMKEGECDEVVTLLNFD